MPASLCLFYPYRLLHPPVHCGDVCVEDGSAQFLLSITSIPFLQYISDDFKVLHYKTKQYSNENL